MRFLIALVFFGLAIWRAVLDWQQTIGQGTAYRLSDVETVWQTSAPESYETYFPALEAANTPILWAPVGETLMGLPAAAVCLFVGIFFYGIRKRRR